MLGNVNESTLADIWNGPRIKHLRASLTSGVVVNKMCQNCENLCSRKTPRFIESAMISARRLREPQRLAGPTVLFGL
jgi:hypothetical protein